MPPQLLALNEGPNILLDKPVLLLGRHPECDIQIDSRKVSRRHCCIAQVDDYLVIRDLGSTNGVRINGQRVTEGKLRPNDELTLGAHRYQVCWDPRDPAEPAPARRTREVAPADEMLESSEEPVPLPDPEAAHDQAPVGRRVGPPPLPPFDDEDSVPAHEESAIVPDDLQLMPCSDVKPPPDTPLSASQSSISNP